MRALLAAAVLLWACAPVPSAWAQSQELSSLRHEIERLRVDLQDLQRYVYTDGEAPTAGASAAAAVDGNSLANAQLRLQQMDERLRALTGEVEELRFRQRRGDERLESLIEALRRGRVSLDEDAAPAMQEPGPAAASDTTGDSLSLEQSTSGVGEGDTPVASVLPEGSEMDRYTFAYSLLRKANYEDAEVAFNEFITLYPSSELSGNAHYWLGETYYVRDRYQDAAIAFLKGYQRFPEGSKAPDNLLKLGMALTRLDKKAEACATFAELRNKFPDAAQPLRDKAAQEAAAAGCG